MKPHQSTLAAPIEIMQSSIQRAVRGTEDFVHNEPAKALAVAFGAGLVLNIIPPRILVGTIIAVTVPFMRPALLALGLVKACEMCCTESNAGNEYYDQE